MSRIFCCVTDPLLDEILNRYELLIVLLGQLGLVSLGPLVYAINGQNVLNGISGGRGLLRTHVNKLCHFPLNLVFVDGRYHFRVDAQLINQRQDAIRLDQ